MTPRAMPPPLLVRCCLIGAGALAHGASAQPAPPGAPWTIRTEVVGQVDIGDEGAARALLLAPAARACAAAAVPEHAAWRAGDPFLVAAEADTDGCTVVSVHPGHGAEGGGYGQGRLHVDTFAQGAAPHRAAVDSAGLGGEPVALRRWNGGVVLGLNGPGPEACRLLWLRPGRPAAPLWAQADGCPPRFSVGADARGVLALLPDGGLLRWRGSGRPVVHRLALGPDGRAAAPAAPSALALVDAGAVLVFTEHDGGTAVSRVEADGRVAWQRAFEPHGLLLAPTARGGAVVVHADTAAAFGTTYVVRRLAPNGATEATGRVVLASRLAFLHGFEPDPDGGVAVVVRLLAGEAVVVVRLHLDGSAPASAAPDPRPVPEPLAVTVIPNPARAGGPLIARIAVPEPGPLTLDVYDVQGRHVGRMERDAGGAGAVDVDLTALRLAAATYVLRADLGGGRSWAVASTTVVR